jgi:hypothetical protein
MQSNKNGMALSYVIIGSIGLVILVVMVILFSGNFSNIDARYSKMYDKDCASMGGVCKPAEECNVPATRVFSKDLIECENKVQTFEDYLKENYKDKQLTRLQKIFGEEDANTNAFVISLKKEICCLS